jgi:uncharacterized protein YndB with AHSA1/START domain
MEGRFGMRTVEVTATVGAAPEAVFTAASDPEQQLRWDAGTLKSVEKLTPGPLGVGARYRGRFKGFGTVEFSFPEFDPPRRFAHLAKVPAGRMRHTFVLEPDGQATRLTQTGELRPNLLGRLMGPMMSRMLRKRFDLVASELDAYLTQREA